MINCRGSKINYLITENLTIITIVAMRRKTMRTTVMIVITSIQESKKNQELHLLVEDDF